MTIIIEVVIFLIVWTLASIVWFICSLGRKNSASRWYDYLFYIPASVVCEIIGFVVRQRDRKKGL